MKKLNIDPKGAAEIAVLLLAVVNQFLSYRGQGPLPIKSDELNYWVSTGFTGIVAIWNAISQSQLTKSTSNNGNSASKYALEGRKKGDNPSEDAK